MSRLPGFVFGAVVLSSTGAASANTWTLTYELPGVQNTTATFFSEGVETFDARSVGSSQSFTTDFGGSSISGTYAGVDISGATQYGGAGGIGGYAVTFSAGGYALALNSEVNYFGYWLSALDAGNVVTFFDGTAQVGQFSAGSVFGAAVTGNSAYFGNPNPSFLGSNGGQPYAFVNFYAVGAGDKFDRIVFSESPTIGGYESDNHTVGLYRDIGGVSLVPEPDTAILLLTGLAVIGRTIRRKPVSTVST